MRLRTCIPRAGHAFQGGVRHACTSVQRHTQAYNKLRFRLKRHFKNIYIFLSSSKKTYYKFTQISNDMPPKRICSMCEQDGCTCPKCRRNKDGLYHLYGLYHRTHNQMNWVTKIINNSIKSDKEMYAESIAPTTSTNHGSKSCAII